MQKYHPESLFDNPVPSDKVNSGHAHEQHRVHRPPKKGINNITPHKDKKDGSGAKQQPMELPETVPREVSADESP